MNKICVFLIFLLFLFLHKTKTYATNLISNSSFEAGKEFWVANSSSVLFEILENTAVDGSMSAKITNNKTSSFGVEQTILGISSTLTYKTSGWIKLSEPFPEKAFIRLAWYKSFDASGSQFLTDDTTLATPSSLWQKFELIKNPPDGVNSAKIRLLIASGSAIFDDILFEEFITPSSTPTPPYPSSSPQTLTISPTSYSSTTPNLTPTPTFALVSHQNIYLSEVYPNPKTGENEWVEIYNDNDFAVNLTNWYIDDIEDGGASSKKISLTIPAKNYAVFDLSAAIFNNDGDAVRLLDFEKKEKDSFEYKNSQKGKSFGRISFESDEFCLQEPSKNQKNNPCVNNLLENFNLNPTISPNSFNSSYENNSDHYQNPILLKKISPIFYFKSIDQILSDQFFISNTKNINQKENAEEILGVYDVKRKSDLKYLNLISFSYALLSALGVAIKNIKFISKKVNIQELKALE